MANTRDKFKLFRRILRDNGVSGEDGEQPSPTFTPTPEAATPSSPTPPHTEPTATSKQVAANTSTPAGTPANPKTAAPSATQAQTSTPASPNSPDEPSATATATSTATSSQDQTPTAAGTSSAAMSAQEKEKEKEKEKERSKKQRIVIDPITRIEGHLRIEIEVQNGKVTNAWSSSTMFRGMEMILKGHDPRQAWVYAQRACGVCTTVHAIASVRAVENALGITIPDNARILRNLMEGSQFIQDHVIHFYHLHATDWVDVVGALSADPAATSKLQKSISSWRNNSKDYFTMVKARLQGFVNSGQLGLFANGYWGHPSMKLPPEANLLAVAHYLEALDWQKEFIKFHALMGGKSPHPQIYLVGGMASPLDPTSPAAITPDKIAALRKMAADALTFVKQVYLPDLLLVAKYYKDWAKIGGGPRNFLSFGDFPINNSGKPSALWLPQGVVMNGQVTHAPAPVDQNMIQEYVTHSWYSYAGGDQKGMQPFSGETSPNYTGPTPPFDFLNTDKKYSWLKAPRYNNKAMEVGPLARMLVAYAAGHSGVRKQVNSVLSKLGLKMDQLYSTIGRVAARGIETQLIAEQMDGWLAALLANIEKGDLKMHDGTKWDPNTWPATAQGYGYTEAPRGALGHWVKIANKQIANYQQVVPTTWNGSPRDNAGVPGTWESALIGTPIADPARPVEVLRVVHSFDPCMSCAVHIIDVDTSESTHIEFF